MWSIYFDSLLIMLLLGFATWLISLVKNNVSIVDSLWSVLFLAAGIYVFVNSPARSSAGMLLMILLALWALRLSVFLTVRNWGEPEDRRYRVIRENNSPHFAFKSLFIVFTLQVLIAWVIFMGLLPGLYRPSELGLQHIIGILLWLIGFTFESTADWQLHTFRKNSAPGDVMQTGLWRYSRHPNYFGEFLIWWAFFLMTVSATTWWVIIAPLIMTVLLLKISGVGMMEAGITSRRPAYRHYIARTSVFFPWMPRSVKTQMAREG